MYTLKALRIYSVKEHCISVEHLFSSNSTPWALIEKKGEIFQSKLGIPY